MRSCWEDKVNKSILFDQVNRAMLEHEGLPIEVKGHIEGHFVYELIQQPGVRVRKAVVRFTNYQLKVFRPHYYGYCHI